MDFFLYLPDIIAQNALSFVLAEKAAKLDAAARTSNEQIQSKNLTAEALVLASLLTLQIAALVLSNFSRNLTGVIEEHVLHQKHVRTTILQDVD